MKYLFWLLLMIPLAISCFAQSAPFSSSEIQFNSGGWTLTTNDNLDANHGGWNYGEPIGADAGDVITLTVDCDHTKNGWCLAGSVPPFAPWIDVPCGATGWSDVELLFDPIVQRIPDGAELNAFQLVPPGPRCVVFFEMTDGWNGHQEYQLVMPFTGRADVNAGFWWVGTSVHYTIHTLNAEQR